MSNFALIHWLIVLLLLLGIPIGIATVAVRSNTGNGVLSRRAFTLRVVGLIIAGLVVSTLVGDGNPIVSGGSTLVTLAFVPYWAVDRLRDMGDPKKNRAIITGVPCVGQFYVLYLMIYRRKS